MRIFLFNQMSDWKKNRTWKIFFFMAIFEHNVTSSFAPTFQPITCWSKWSLLIGRLPPLGLVPLCTVCLTARQRARRGRIFPTSSARSRYSRRRSSPSCAETATATYVSARTLLYFGFRCLFECGNCFDFCLNDVTMEWVNIHRFYSVLHSYYFGK